MTASTEQNKAHTPPAQLVSNYMKSYAQKVSDNTKRLIQVTLWFQLN